jgi:hypothetical protein
MKIVFLFLSFFSSCAGTFGLFPEEGNPQGSIYFNEKKREMIKSDKYYLPDGVRSCEFQGDVWAPYHHPANGFALVLLVGC